MYIEILHDTVGELINSAKSPITITLPSIIYNELHIELNEKCKITTDIPIEGFKFSGLVMYGRTITIEKGDKLDSVFEANLVRKLESLTNARNSTKDENIVTLASNTDTAC